MVHFENRNEIKVFWKAPKYEIVKNQKKNKLTKNGDIFIDSAAFDRHMSHLIESFNPHQFNDESLLERGTKGILRFHNKYSRAVIVERNRNKWICKLKILRVVSQLFFRLFIRSWFSCFQWMQSHAKN